MGWFLPVWLYTLNRQIPFVRVCPCNLQILCIWIWRVRCLLPKSGREQLSGLRLLPPGWNLTVLRRFPVYSVLPTR